MEISLWFRTLFRGKWAVLFLLFIGCAAVNLVLVSSYIKISREPLETLRATPRAFDFDLPNLRNPKGCRIPDLPLYDNDNETRSAHLAPLPVFSCTNKIDKNKLWSWFDSEGRIRIRPVSVPQEEWNKSVSCGYKVITRAGKGAGSQRDYVTDISSLIPVSQSAWRKGFHLEAEFVQVNCNYPGGSQVEYHAIPTLANNPRRDIIQRKLDFWRGKEEEELPPNILLLGQDATTRLNFRRHGKRMVEFLESIGAHEMKGYVKVGFNTFPNIVPLLSGYSLPEYESACLGNWDTDFQDNCPLLFSKLDQLNYLTSYIEDDTGCAIFHSRKRGFFNQTTDFNPRPIVINVENKNTPPSCARSSTFLLDYLTRTTAFARNNRAPLFSFFFFTSDTHGLDVGGLQYSDEIYVRFLSSLDLSNTVLFVFSDHGLRSARIARLMQVQLEGNLPNLWVHLGEKVKRRWPEWEEALKMNEPRIFSAFNFYSTLNKILDSYAKKPVPLTDAVEKGTGTPIPRKPFISFLEVQREDANCTDIGVPLAFCPCGAVEFLPDFHNTSISAANFALAEINSRLRNFPCQKLRIAVAGGVGVRGSAFLEDRKALLVMFGTTPGNAEVQATLEVRSNGAFAKLLNSDRLNRVDKSLVASCSRNLTQWTELFCVCNNTISKMSLKTWKLESKN